MVSWLWKRVGAFSFPHCTSVPLLLQVVFLYLINLSKALKVICVICSHTYCTHIQHTVIIYNTLRTPFMMINYCMYLSVCVFICCSKVIVLDIDAMLFTPLQSVQLTSCRLCG